MAEAQDKSVGSSACTNCNSSILGQVSRCGVCKKATYCSRKCQQEDWRFHKRICKAPAPEPEKSSSPPVDPDELKRQMDELTKDKDPKLAAQMKQMMAGMAGIETKPEPEKPPEVPCQSCAKPCEKPLRCGKCKQVSYCSAQCQKEDWRFHKRLCSAPPSAAPKETSEQAAPAAAPVRPKENETVVVNDDVGSWYKHREWKPQEERKEFTPAKLEQPASQEARQEPLPKAAAKAGSAWNAAGTWEEKNMLPWWQERLQGLQALCNEEDVLQIDKLGAVTGEASVVHVRGQPKFMYDISFDLSFSGLQRCKACAKSAPGCRCSNCMRFLGKIKVSDLCWDSEGSVTLKVQAEEPSGPSHVKKAGQKECSSVAEETLLPAMRDFLQTCVAEYKATATSEGPKWRSQLPPSSADAWQGASPATPQPLPPDAAQQ